MIKKIETNDVTPITYPLTKPVCQLNSDGFFVSQTDADLDPLSNDGTYLLPAGCVDADPPQMREGYVPKWDDTDWQYLPDFRGQTAYHTQTGESIIIDAVGDVPDGYVIAEARPSQYHTWGGKAWILTAEGQKQQLADLKHSKLLELNQAAQAYITQAAQTDKVPDFEVASWTIQATEAKTWAADNTASTPVLDRIAASRGIDADKLKTAALRKTLAYEQLTAHVMGERQALQTKIEAAKTIEALDKIVIAFSEIKP